MNLPSRLLLAAATLVAASSSSAASATWDNGAATQIWQDIANWNPDGTVGLTTDVYTSTDAATFSTTGSGTVDLGGLINISGLNFGAGAGNANAFIIGDANDTLNLTHAGTTLMGAGVTVTEQIGVTGTTLKLSNVASSTYSFTNNSGTAAAKLNIAGNITTAASSGTSVLTLGGTNGGTISGIIADGATANLGLTKTGSSTWTLTGANTYTGITTISAGTLQVGNGGSTGSLGSGNVTDNGTLTFNRTGTYTVTNNISGTGTITFAAAVASATLSGTVNVATMNVAATQTVTLTAANTINTLNITSFLGGGYSATQVPTVILNNTGGGNAVSGNINLANGNYSSSGVLQLGASDQIADTSVIAMGNSSANHYGSHAYFALMGNNETIGALSYTNGSSANNKVFNGGTANSTLTFAGTGTNTYNGVLTNNNGSGAGTLSIVENSVGGTQVIAGAASYTGTTMVTSGTLSFRNSTFVGSTATVNGGTLDFQGETTVSSAIGGSTGFVTISGGTTTNFSGGNKTYGVDTVLSGTSTTLTQTAVNSFSANSIHNIGTGATLDTGNFAGSVKALTGAGSVNLNGASANLTLTDGAGQVFSGVISGAGGLTKIGSGTQSLTGASTYAGVTTVNGGKLLLDFSAGGAPTNNILNNAANSSALVLGGGTLEIKGRATAATQQFNGVSGSGTLLLTPNGGGAVTVNLGAVTGTGTINFSGADTTVTGGVATAGSLSFITSTTTINNNGTGRLGANLWNGTDWASTASDGTNTYVVQWQGLYTDLTTQGNAAAPLGDVRVVTTGSTGTGTAATYAASTVIGSLLMAATTFDTTVDIGAGQILTVGNGVGATGAVGIAGGAKSLTIGSTVNQGTLTAGTSGAGTLALNNQSTAGGVLTVNAVIADNTPTTGVVSLVTSGAVVLNGANTYTGSTTINVGGTLQVAGAGTLGSGTYAGAISNNGILQYSSGTAQTLSGAITGTGALVKDTAGSTLILIGTNTYSGGTTVNAGMLQIGNGTTNGTMNGAFTVASGATLRYLRAADTTAPTWANVSGTGVFSVMTNRANSGTTNVWGDVALTSGFTGTLQIERGRVSTANAASLGASTAVIVQSGGQLGLWNGGTFNQNMTVAGTGYGETNYESAIRLANSGFTTTLTGSVALSGNATLGATGIGILSGNMTGSAGANLSIGTTNQAGTVVLSGTNTYAGTTTVNFGTLQFAQKVSLYNNATANWTAANLTVASGATAAFNVGGTGEFIDTDITNLIALSNVSSGTPATQGFKSGSLIGLDTTNATGGNFTYGSVIANHVAGATIDTVGLSKLGTGTLTLTGVNTYTGATNITAGTLEIGGTGQLGAGSYAGNIANAGTLRFSSSATQTLSGIISGTGSVIKTGAGTLILAATDSYTGALTVAGGGTVILQSASGSASSFTGSALNINGASTMRFQGLTGGTRRRDVVGKTVTFDATGGGTLDVGANMNWVFQNNTVVTNGGVRNNLTSTGGTTLNLNTGTLTFNVARGSDATSDLTVSAAFGNTAAAITKSGAGILALTGANTYTGVTTISAGVLDAAILANGGTNSAIGASTNAAANLVFGAPAATLRYTGSGSVTTNRGFTTSSGAGGGATIESSGSGTLSFDNTIAIAYGTTNETRSLTLGGTNTGANTFAKVIANNGTAATSLTKVGSGTWTLSGNNTHTGGTIVSAGTLIAGSSTAFGTGAVAVNTGGTLNVNGLVLANAMTVNGGTLAGGAGSMLSGPVTVGAAGVVIASGANIALNGNLTLATGAITVNGAGLVAITSGGALTLGGSGNLNLGGAFDTYAGGGTYTLISGTFAGPFANASNVSGYNTSVWSNVSFDNNTGNLVFSAVPEPSTYGLIGAGALAGVALVRRRRKLTGKAA